MSETTPTTPQDAPQDAAEPKDAQQDQGASSEPQEDAQTFPREYVEKLRRESAGYRERAGRADDLARALWTARVAATGRLADPEDLPFDEDALDDPEALNAAVDALLARRPHYASRRPTGDVGQGAVPAAETFSLAGLLSAGA